VRTDVGYHRTTEALGIRALETDRLLNEIEDTKSQNRLTVIGILVGSFIGIGQILPGNLDFWWRLGISVGGGIVLSLAYWLWSNTGYSARITRCRSTSRRETDPWWGVGGQPPARLVRLPTRRT
jgi:hypothetical protein